MVHLNRIYTRTGDDGTTALGDGTRLPKYHLRIAAYGTVDEASSVLGLIVAHGLSGEYREWVLRIQNELFDLGSDLCVPGATDDRPRITADYTRRLEEHIDAVNEGLEPLDSFILPGGTPLGAWFHLARTVCRRAERITAELADLETERGRVNPEVVRYLNRLSDLLFVLGRAVNDGGALDVTWRPGGGGE